MPGSCLAQGCCDSGTAVAPHLFIPGWGLPVHCFKVGKEDYLQDRCVCVNEQKRDEGLGGLRLLSWEKAEKLLIREWDFREGGFLYI